jgi:hypothetical protein
MSAAGPKQRFSNVRFSAGSGSQADMSIYEYTA